MQDYQKYWEFHTFNYKGIDYIFQPFEHGHGFWHIKTPAGKAAVHPIVPPYLQEEINRAFFDDPYIPSMYELFMKADYKQREKLRVESQTWLSLKIKAVNENLPIDEGPIPIREKNNKMLIDGGLYIYKYDAKQKETLPYWDKFPLVLLLDHSSTFFWGLNFHYLSPNVRMAFLNKLLNTYKKYDHATDTLTAKTGYYDLKANINLKEFLPCYKQYYISRIHSKILKIESHEWLYVTEMQNIAQWEKNKKTKTSDIYERSEKGYQKHRNNK
jgi:hypothetical protein